MSPEWANLPPPQIARGKLVLSVIVFGSLLLMFPAVLWAGAWRVPGAGLLLVIGVLMTELLLRGLSITFDERGVRQSSLRGRCDIEWREVREVDVSRGANGIVVMDEPGRITVSQLFLDDVEATKAWMAARLRPFNPELAARVFTGRDTSAVAQSIADEFELMVPGPAEEVERRITRYLKALGYERFSASPELVVYRREGENFDTRDPRKKDADIHVRLSPADAGVALRARFDATHAGPIALSEREALFWDRELAGFQAVARGEMSAPEVTAAIRGHQDVARIRRELWMLPVAGLLAVLSTGGAMWLVSVYARAQLRAAVAVIPLLAVPLMWLIFYRTRK